MLPHDLPVDDPTPRIEPCDTPEGPCALVRGRWAVAHIPGPEAWKAMVRILRTLPRRPAATGGQPMTAMAWDLREAGQIDHIGAQLLWNHWGRQWPAMIELLPGQRAVLERVARYSEGVAPQGASVQPWRDRLNALGARLFQLGSHVRDLTRLVGQLVLDAWRLVCSPASGPWRDVSGHLYHIGARALPITALVGALIGVVLAYLISQQLRQLGADSFIVDILGLSLIREIGPVLAAILLAGRSGSAITAQIGVMRVTEELDAMRVMGIAPGFRLVLPRAMAMMVVMPLISAWTTAAALLGGVLASTLTLGIAPEYFLIALPKAVQASNLVLALSKSVVFGLLIALVACHYGMRIKPNTESLGAGTTSSVVVAITGVIVVNALFAVVFKNVGI